MVDTRDGQARWDWSAEGWIRLMREGDLNRTMILDAPMLALAGDVAGKRVLDVGCGEGRFCRMLAERGAIATGVDPTRSLLTEASARSGGAFLRGSGEALPFEDGRFDLAVAYLVLIDIPDYRAAIREMARVLKADGRVIVANLNPFVTTRDRAWTKDENGRRTNVPVDNYFGERALALSWAGIEIVNWHRPLEDYMEAYLGAGLILEHFAEPRPTPEAVQAHPDLECNVRVPLFHVMRWRK